MSASQRCYEAASPEDGAGVYLLNGFGGDLGKCLLGIGDTAARRLPHLADLHNRLTEHLTRSAREHHADTAR